MLIDSNILIYAINADSPKHKKAQQFLQKHIKDLEVTHQNVLETIRVLTHSKFPHPMKISATLLAIEAIIKQARLISPTLTTYYLSLQLIRKYKLSGNRIFDGYLAATALSNDIKTIATDNTKDFKKFTGLKTINPFS